MRYVHSNMGKWLLVLFLATMTGCDDSVTDFGFDGEIRGLVVDPSGSVVSGDVTIAGLTVYALGELDDEPMQIRVKGDGSFTNTHLYPQSYRVWVEGPVTTTEEVTVDLSGDPVERNLTVTPFLSIPPPGLVGNPSSNEVEVSYTIVENGGHVAGERLVYASTSSWPSQSTGSGPYWHTVTVELPANEGAVSITDLEPQTTYFIRVAARAEGADDWNISDQIVVETP